MAFGKVLNILIKRSTINSIRLENSIDSIYDKIEKKNLQKDELIEIINKKRSIGNVVNVMRNNINTIHSSSGKVEIIINVLNSTVNFIKVLPIPTAVAGVGIPIGIITTFADTLDNIKFIIKENQSLIKEMGVALEIIGGLLNNILNKLNLLDLKILEHIKKYEDIDDLMNEIQLNIQEYEDKVNPNLNKIEEDLINLLKIDASPPYIYKEHKLVLETTSDLGTLIPKRRIKAINTNQPRFYKVRNLYKEDDSWSYTDSIKTLVDEMKFILDVGLYFETLEYADGEPQRLEYL